LEWAAVWRVALLALVAVLLGGSAFAQQLTPSLDPSQVELDDVMEMELLDRDLYAFDLIGSATPVVRLEIGEEMIWSRSEGRVALAMTDRRILAASPGVEAWRELRYRVHETPAASGLISTRVALVVTDKRALGYDATASVWLAIDLGPQEHVTDSRVGAGTALILTNRTAYGLSPSAGGFFKTKLELQERVTGLRVRSNMAMVSTTKRVLVFRAPIGQWTEQRRPIN